MHSLMVDFWQYAQFHGTFRRWGLKNSQNFTGPYFKVLYTCQLLKYFLVLFCSILSLTRSEGWPHHGHTFSIYLCPLSFWLTVPRGVLSTCWCCSSRPCMVFVTCMHLALFVALSHSPGNSLVSLWCDHTQCFFCGRQLISWKCHSHESVS